MHFLATTYMQVHHFRPDRDSFFYGGGGGNLYVEQLVCNYIRIYDTSYYNYYYNTTFVFCLTGLLIKSYFMSGQVRSLRDILGDSL